MRATEDGFGQAALSAGVTGRTSLAVKFLEILLICGTRVVFDDVLPNWRGEVLFG